MSRKLLFGVVALGILSAAMVWQRARLGELRTRNERLIALKAEADRLTIENLDLPALQVANLRDTGTGNELLRLRNQVRQLRAQQPQIDQLRAENERLAAANRSAASPRQEFSQMEGFMAKESWNNAGFATPENALQTFFWAVREGDLAMLAECVPPQARQHFIHLNEPGNEQERDRTLAEVRGLIAGVGIRVVDRESTDDGKATVGIQAAAGGAIMKLQFRRFGAEWKVKDF